MPVGVLVAERAQRLEAAAGAGAQAPRLAPLLEPLLQLPGLRPVPDADQLDLAAGVQGDGQQPGALTAVAVGFGVVPAGQVLLPARGEVGGEAAVVLGMLVRRADVREVRAAAPARRAAGQPDRPEGSGGRLAAGAGAAVRMATVADPAAGALDPMDRFRRSRRGRAGHGGHGRIPRRRGGLSGAAAVRPAAVVRAEAVLQKHGDLPAGRVLARADAPLMAVPPGVDLAGRRLLPGRGPRVVSRGARAIAERRERQRAPLTRPGVAHHGATGRPIPRCHRQAGRPIPDGHARPRPIPAESPRAWPVARHGQP
jgi:hypothetical protein